ncbi:MAG: hypothetical protein WEB00_05185 [Dehalococcoidia bacterium]
MASELEHRGFRAVVPVLSNHGEGLYWRRHARQVAAAIGDSRLSSLVLVGHSGAGGILPVIAAELGVRPAAYVFVDAGVPEDGKSRFDLFGDVEPVEWLRSLAQNGYLPPWNTWFPAEALAEIMSEPELRERFVAELPSMPIAVYEEPLPVFPAWPDAPCVYLQLSSSYDADRRRAEALGAVSLQREGGHFDMLTDPVAVADDLIELLNRVTRSA